MDSNENVRILKDRLSYAKNAYLNSKTEKEITSLREVIDFLKTKIRQLQTPVIIEEALE